MKNLITKIQSKLSKKQLAVIVLAILSVIVIAICSIYVSKDIPYSVKEKEITFEVKSKFDEANDKVIANIQKDKTALTKEESKSLKTDFEEKDLEKIGEKDVKYYIDDKEVAKTKVIVKDTTKPDIKIEDFEVEQFVKLTDYKSLADKTKVQLSDNYDEVAELEKSVNIKGYDSEKEGEQKVTISIKDSSGNQTSVEVKVTVKKFEMPEESEPKATPVEEQQYNMDDIPYAESSSSNNGSGNNGSGNSGWTNDSGGNSGGSSGGSTPAPVPTPTPPVVEEPVTPPAACPGGMDPALPCDFTPNNVGNTGLIFNSLNELYDYADSQGWSVKTYVVFYLNYNDGSIKYSINLK